MLIWIFRHNQLMINKQFTLHSYYVDVDEDNCQRNKNIDYLGVPVDLQIYIKQHDSFIFRERDREREIER